MIRIKDIQSALLHVVGWDKESYTSPYEAISEDLTASDSGLLFQQAHPLITLQNLQSIAPDFSAIQYQDWNAETTYKAGVIVKAEDKYYKALVQSTGVEVNDTESWKETTPFSEWLEAKTRSSISKAIVRYINDKLVKGTTKNILEHRPLFDGTGRITDLEKNKENFVGFEIVPIRAKGTSVKINKIGLQFTKPGTYKLYLWHSSSEMPERVIELERTKANSFEWFNIEDLYLPYISSTKDAGGSWYLGYFQSELPEGSQAIRKDRDWSKGPCTACSRREYEAWMVWSKFIEIHPMFVNEELIDRLPEEPIEEEPEEIQPQDDEPADEEPVHNTGTPKLWDVDNNQYIYNTNYGLNLDITIGCDITDFIIEQKHLFADIISKQLAVDMLREFAYNSNVRTNRRSINASRPDILYEIDGDSSSMRRSGLSFELEQAIKAIELSTEGIDRICMNCVNHGVKYRTI